MPMNKIEKMIMELCPNGVEWKKLEELCNDIRGMSGVSKKWEDTGNCRFIDYMNAYKNIVINVKKHLLRQFLS